MRRLTSAVGPSQRPSSCPSGPTCSTSNNKCTWPAASRYTLPTPEQCLAGEESDLPKLKIVFSLAEDVAARWLALERRYRDEDLWKQLDFRPKLPHTPHRSPLTKLWQQFLEAQPWHESVAAILATLLDKHSGLPEQLRVFSSPEWRIDTTQAYRAIQAARHRLPIQEALAEVDQVAANIRGDSRVPHSETAKDQLACLRVARWSLVELEEQRGRPAFCKCFLVMGGIGSGKTYFLAELLGDHRADGGMLYLPLEAHKRDVPLEPLVLNRCRGANGAPWQDLRQFDAFFRRHGWKLKPEKGDDRRQRPGSLARMRANCAEGTGRPVGAGGNRYVRGPGLVCHSALPRARRLFEADSPYGAVPQAVRTCRCCCENSPHHAAFWVSTVTLRPSS